MKKIIGLSLAALVLLALTATGTWAFFNDSETSTDNIFTAGTLNLQVGDSDPMIENIDFQGILPGDSPYQASWLIHNNGSLDGRFSLAVGEVDNLENGWSEVEEASGDDSSGEAQGELGGMLELALWMDNGADGWSGGDYYLDPSVGLDKVSWESGSSLPGDAYFTLNSFSGKSLADLQIVAAGDAPGYFRVDCLFPEGGSDDNRAQSDSCTFDLSFSLSQVQ